MVLQQFAMHTVDANGQRTFKGKAARAKGGAPSLDFTHKLCQVSGMAVYCIRAPRNQAHAFMTPDEAHRRMQNDVLTYTSPSSPSSAEVGANRGARSFVLHPWSPQLRITKNEAQAETERGIPRYSLSCQCDQTHLQLSQLVSLLQQVFCKARV